LQPTFGVAMLAAANRVANFEDGQWQREQAGMSE
jgi:hypothetical protein